MSQLERIYSHLPIALQHLAVTAQGFRFSKWRYGNGFQEYLDELRALEFAPWQALAARQSAEFLSIIGFALRHVPFYRQKYAGRSASELGIHSTADLSRLSMTTKEDVRKHHFAFIAEPMRNAPLISWCTSGTTGTPLKVLYSRDAMTRMWAFVENYRLHAGVSRSLRRAQFTGKVIVPGRQPTEARVFWRYDLANHCLLLSSYHLRSVNLSHYADALDRFAPRYMSGYPSAIYALADYYMRSGRSAPRLVAVLTSAETMVQEQRQTIEKVFNTRVFDQYGQTEMQSFWYECELGRMHAHPLAGITEIVKPDGTPAAPGELGEVVLTGLSNRAMPLIRYRTGDAASFAPEACGCGRSMPVVGLLLGRMDDMIVTRERGVIGRLDPVFKGVRKVKEAQLVQMSADRLRVRLAVDAAFGDVDRRKLETNIRDRVGSEIRLEFEICDGISRGPNGKFRAVISHLTAAERQQLLGNVQPRV